MNTPVINAYIRYLFAVSKGNLKYQSKIVNKVTLDT